MQFSIIIPIYNVELYLKDCLDSILNQKFTDFELICVNDGSTDTSLSILESYQDSRIKIINQKNSGLSAARNAGLDIAIGKYIWFVDSDDKIEPDSLLQLYNYILTNNSPNLIFFNSDVFFQTDNLKDLGWSNYKRSFYGLIKPVDFFNIENERKTFFVSACMYIFNRERNNNIRFIDGILHEDNPFIIQLIWNNPNNYCLSVNHSFFKRRIRPNSIMTSKKNDHHFYGYHLCINAINNFKNERNIRNSYLNNFISNLCISNFHTAWQIDKPLISLKKRDILKSYSKLPFLSKKRKIILKYPILFSLYFLIKRI